MAVGRWGVCPVVPAAAAVAAAAVVGRPSPLSQCRESLKLPAAMASTLKSHPAAAAKRLHRQLLVVAVSMLAGALVALLLPLHPGGAGGSSGLAVAVTQVRRRPLTPPTSTLALPGPETPTTSLHPASPASHFA